MARTMTALADAAARPLRRQRVWRELARLQCKDALRTEGHAASPRAERQQRQRGRSSYSQ